MRRPFACLALAIIVALPAALFAAPEDPSSTVSIGAVPPWVTEAADAALRAPAAAARDPEAYLLFDRMVAFHIQRGAGVPLSAAEFYAGLRERFIDRDGMFFLADQVLDLFFRNLAHSQRRGCPLEKGRSDLVHLLVGGLRAQ